MVLLERINLEKKNTHFNNLSRHSLNNKENDGYGYDLTQEQEYDPNRKF
jgi:hypothetical protein